MLKSEMHHQFWITKKTVQRKLGSKEDECIILSDAELDSKIELFKSLSESSGNLFRIVDQYQERLCILAQEENFLGKHLKETGKNSNTTGNIMVNAGKAISYCGQTRVSIRPSLLRLLNELEVFRGRAVADTQSTINIMEKERTEYRAALSWMKYISSQLDPDSDRALDKFRKAQNHVRVAKTKFDRLSLDCLQKIDLLAAARCNLFSHALVTYMSTLLQFILKSSETFKASSNSFSKCPQYSFNILKELSQIDEGNNVKEHNEVNTLDADQTLFFLDEFLDAGTNADKDLASQPYKIKSVENLLDISQTQTNSSNIHLDNSSSKLNDEAKKNISMDLLDEIMPEKLSECVNNHLNFNSSSLINPIKPSTPNVKENKNADKLNRIEKIGKSDWFQLFSELDILSNPDEIVSKLDVHGEHAETA